MLLPFVPFRSFALKGWIAGMLSMAAVMPFVGLSIGNDVPLFIAAWLFFPAMSSYIALQFTGSTTFTGMTGVKKELKFGIPAYLAVASLSLILVVVYKLKEWEVL